MSQYDFGNLESPLTGTALINTHLEPWRNALHSLHSGSSRPSYAAAGTMWLDTTANPWLLKVFDGSDDIPLAHINTTTNIMTFVGDVRAAGSGGINFYNSSGTLVGTLGAAGSTGGTWKGQNNFEGTLQAEGKFALKNDSELTISSGAVTIIGSNHTIDTESDAASDDLDTINGAVDGGVLLLRAANAARTVVLKHGTGNITTPDGADITLDETSKVVTLAYDAELSDWLVVSAMPVSASGGWVPLLTQTVSVAVASVDFTSGIDSTYKKYAIVFTNVVPATDGQSIVVRMGNGGTFDSGSSDYAEGREGAEYSSTGSDSGGASTSSSIRVSPNVGSGTGESLSGILYLADPSNANYYTHIYGQCVYLDASAVGNMLNFAGARLEAAAHDRIQFLAGSGNISVGTFTLYGLAGA